MIFPFLQARYVIMKASRVNPIPNIATAISIFFTPFPKKV
jgi:hypothetical protein